MTEEKSCQGCSNCCKYISIIIPAPKNYEDLDEIRWFLLHNARVYLDHDDEWIVEAPLKCNYLDENGRCKMFTPEHYMTRSQDLEEAYQDAGQFYWTNRKRQQGNKSNIV